LNLTKHNYFYTICVDKIQIIIKENQSKKVNHMKKHIKLHWSASIMLFFAVPLALLPMQACSQSEPGRHDVGSVMKDGTITVKLEKGDETVFVLDGNNDITQVISVKNGMMSPVVQCQFCTPELKAQYPDIGENCEKLWTSNLIKQIFAAFKKKHDGKDVKNKFRNFVGNTDMLSKMMLDITNGILPVCSATTKEKNLSGLDAFVKQTSFGSHKCGIYLKVGGHVMWEAPAGCGGWEH